MSVLTAEFDMEAAKRVWGEESREDEKIRIAKNMIADGESTERIMRYTGLSREEIENLK